MSNMIIKSSVKNYEVIFVEDRNYLIYVLSNYMKELSEVLSLSLSKTNYFALLLYIIFCHILWIIIEFYWSFCLRK